MNTIRLFLALLVAGLISSISIQATAETTKGIASYYAPSLHGNKTASGELYDHNAMTAAHRTLEFGTTVRVTYIKTGKSVEVRVNDRGPYAEDRLIDLSGAAAEKIGLASDGIGEVTIQVSE